MGGMGGGFGESLKEWRKRRRFSQLQLAEEMGVSSRHISFLEKGRSEPSKEMVLNIGEFLQIPKREINRMLVVAGHAQVFPDHLSTGEGLSYVNYALDKLLGDHMPYPALVLNREWSVVKANGAARALMEQIGFVSSGNLIECILNDDPACSHIVNWGETVSIILSRLRYEIDMLGGSDELERLEYELRSYIDSKNIPVCVDYNKAVMTTKFSIGTSTLSYFSLISQLGAILDVTASEYKVELMFPGDEVTKSYHCES